MPGGVIPAACRSARWAHPRGHYIHRGITTPLPWLLPVRRHRVHLHQSDCVDADANRTSDIDELWSELDSACKRGHFSPSSKPCPKARLEARGQQLFGAVPDSFRAYPSSANRLFLPAFP